MKVRVLVLLFLIVLLTGALATMVVDMFLGVSFEGMEWQSLVHKITYIVWGGLLAWVVTIKTKE